MPAQSLASSWPSKMRVPDAKSIGWSCISIIVIGMFLGDKKIDDPVAIITFGALVGVSLAYIFNNTKFR